MAPPDNSGERSEKFYLIESAMLLVDEAVLITTTELDPPGPEIVYVNEGFCRMTGYTAEEVIGKTPRILQGPKTDRAELDRLRCSLSRGEPFDGGETINYRKDGSEYVLSWYIVPLRDEVGEITHWMASQRDVTERNALEKQLRHQAFHDSLTDLPNRALFTDRLEHALDRAGRRRSRVAVLFMDLDNFKLVNDSLGHGVGDELLVAVAGRLKTSVRAEDTLTRFGGDEFTVLLEDVAGVTGATRASERIMEVLREPFAVQGREIFVTISIGIALTSTDSNQPEELLRDADAAMYRAKEKGKASYEIFDQSTRAPIVKRFDLENDLRQALDRKEFALHYQPKVSLKTGNITGVEALIRWEHPKYGLLSPAEFIPVAEETGLIVPMGQWVLEEACRRAREWQGLYLSNPPLRVSVNLSVRQLWHPGLVRDVGRVLQDTGLEASTLSLEITESVLIQDLGRSLAALGELKRLGIRLLLDDFGTGYSSLSYLKDLPVDRLKIDRSFVGELTSNSDSAKILAGITSIAHSLDLKVIAEGVESAEQMRLVRALGCDRAQGYYFSRPLPAEAMERLLKERRSFI